MKITLKLEPTEKWLEDLARQLGTTTETATKFTMRYGDSFIRVNTVPFNRNFVPLVGELSARESLSFCKEEFSTNDYWTLQIIKSTRKHRLRLTGEKGESIVVESENSCVFFSSKMQVELDFEENQQTTVLSVNLHKDWLCEQLGISESSETEDVALRECLTSESASWFAVRVFPDWIDGLISNVNAFNWKLMLQAKCLQLIAEISHQLRGKKTEISKLNVRDLQKIEAIEEKYFGVNQLLPTIEFLAREVSMSVSKFKKCFKTRFGSAPYEYHLNLKLEVAKNQLLENRWTISEIASQLGYTSTANFDKAFKKKFLVNPTTMLRNAS